MSTRLKRRFAWTCIFFAQLAALLNFVSAVDSARRGLWLISGLHLLIAVALSGATLVGWYVTTRQRPYRWREKDP